MKKFASLMLPCIILLVMAASAIAGEREGAVSLSPFIGGYTFDGVQHFETSPVFGLRLGYDLTKNWGVEAVGDYLATKGTLGNQSINALSYRLDILYNIMPGGPLVPYVAAGGGGITYGHGGNGLEISNRTTDATANVGLGVKYFVTDSIALRCDARQLFVMEDPNSPRYNWEYSAGLTFLLGGKTPAAPAAEPAPAPVAVPEPAAAPAPVPVAPAPTSNLSVTPATITQGGTATLNWSSQDATTCGILPGIGSVKPQGSVDVTPAADTNYTLSCSGAGGATTSNANVRVEAPKPVAKLAPTADLAVAPASLTQGDSAELTWSSQNATNCDIQPGIGAVKPEGTRIVKPSVDTAYTLTCSGEGGTINRTANVSVVAPKPAPKPAPEPEQLCVVLNVEFATAKADVPAKYHDEIAKIAKLMKQYPDVKGVIEGHTDNQGGKAYNEKLSMLRAQSVKNYIVKKFGIDGSRLAVKGYGFSRPVANNATAAGRKLNRRIVANFGCVQK